MADLPKTDTEQIARLTRIVHSHSATILALTQMLLESPGFDIQKFQELFRHYSEITEAPLPEESADQKMLDLLRRFEGPPQ